MEDITMIVSKELLEETIKKKIYSYVVKSGSNVGDNYLSIIYSIVVNLEIGERIHLLAKCYPTHPARQLMLNKSNYFWNELQIYKLFLPAIQNISDVAGLNIKLHFPPCIGGNAIDFKNVNENEKMKIYEPFEIFVLMEDMRASGFSMAERNIGLDLDHVRLAVMEYAKLHALSWAYKQMHDLEKLSSEFPFLEFVFDDAEGYELMMGVFGNSIKTAAEAIQLIFGKNAQATVGTLKLIDKLTLFLDILFKSSSSEQDFSKMLRIQQKENPKEAAWKVILHGDSWTNNFLFRYNEATKKPIEIVLVDLQAMREGCPTIDLAYLIYSSTTTSLRAAHLHELLTLYHQCFTDYCVKLGVNPLPNFTIEELERRFHRAKICGYIFSTLVMPLMFKETKDIQDLEKSKGESVIDVVGGITEISIEENEYARRISSLAQELYEEGII